MQSLLWFLFWFALYGGWSTQAVPADTAAQPAVQAAVAGEPFTLEQGATAALDDGKLAITFAGVVEDSRCPADVMCAWSGQAIVEVRVQEAGGAEQTVELGGFTDSQGVLQPQRSGLETQPSTEIGGYTVDLLAVTPYPATAGQPPAAEAYTITLVVR